MDVTASIRAAEAVLPGRAAPDGREDPRWQALLDVAEHIESDPDAVWDFARHWADHDDEDLRAGVAACLLEHLLEHHFERIFPRVELACAGSVRFADTFRRCWKFGESELPRNAARFDALQRSLGRIPPAG